MKQTQKGYALIIGVIILTASFMLIVVLGARSIRYSTSIIQEQIDQSESDLLAESCAQTLLRYIVDDPSYVGNETFSTAEGDCIVGAIAVGTPVDVQIQTIVEGHSTRLLITLDSKTPPSISNWLRVDSF